MTTWTPEPLPTAPGMGLSLTSDDPRNWTMRAVLGAPRPPKDKRWRRWRPIWDQGRTSSCVGQTWAGMGVTRPHYGLLSRLARRNVPDGLVVYDVAQDFDNHPGKEPEMQGSSTLGGAKAARHLGLIRSFRFANSTSDVLEALSYVGPVATGLLWTRAMAQPLPTGHPNDNAGTEVIGGHETLLVAVDVSAREVEGVNSWGAGWGAGGRFRWSWDFLEQRLADRGDACLGETG